LHSSISILTPSLISPLHRLFQLSIFTTIIIPVTYIRNICMFAACVKFVCSKFCKLYSHSLSLCMCTFILD
jgi:hypothetical protein